VVVGEVVPQPVIIKTQTKRTISGIDTLFMLSPFIIIPIYDSAWFSLDQD
jgi:hypothetical protein